MKVIIIIFIGLLSQNLCFGQEDNNPLPYVMKEPQFDIAPQFPGGSDAMMKYFADSIRYPEPERSRGKQGYVLVKFVVTKKGEITDIVPVNGVPGAPNFVKEAVRVLESMPKWIPATKKGKRVQADYDLAVPFKLGKTIPKK